MQYTSTEFDDMALVTITDDGCHWGSLEDPFGEVVHSYYQTVLFLAQHGGFKEAQKIYGERIDELNHKLHVIKLLH